MTVKSMVQALGRSLVLVAVMALVLDLRGDSDNGLLFKLDFRTDQSTIAENTVGNAIDLGKASKTSGGNAIPRKVQQTTVNVPDPVYSWRNTEERAFDFPQYTTDADGTLRIDPVAMVFTDSAVTTFTQTVYIRFCWGGSVLPTQGHHSWLALNGYDYSTKGVKGSTGTGWGLSIYNLSIPAGEAEYGYLGWLVPRASGSIADWGGSYTAANSPYRIATNVWYDLFVTMEPSSSDPSKTYLIFRLAKAVAANTKPSWAQNFTVTANATLDFSPSKSTLRLGSEAVALGWDPLPDAANANDGIYKKSFRGKISRVMIWNRTLTDAEMWETLAGASGSDWRIGIVNGRADEFAAVDSGTAVDEVWATSNTWSIVRRALTQEHPSLTIKDVIPVREEGVGKILSVKPVISGASSFPVEIRVNGTRIREVDLATYGSRAIFIPGEKWQNGEDGYVAIQLVRKAPFTGTLELDAIQLCGGWVMNERSLMTGSETILYSPYRIGIRDPQAIKAGSSVWPASLAYFSTQNIVAYIPDEALGRFRYELSLSIPNASEADLPHSFHVNGNRFAEFATVPIGTTLKAQVPPSLLTAGQNTFVISNGAVNCWCNWAYRIDVKKLHSLSISFR